MQNDSRQEVVPKSPSTYSPQTSYHSHIISSPAMSTGPMPTAYARQGTFFDPTKEDRGGSSAMTSPAARIRSPIVVCTKNMLFQFIPCLTNLLQESHNIDRRPLERGYTSPAKPHSRPTSAYSHSPPQGINLYANPYQHSPESRRTLNQTMPPPPSRSFAVSMDRQPPSAVRRPRYAISCSTC